MIQSAYKIIQSNGKWIFPLIKAIFLVVFGAILYFQLWVQNDIYSLWAQFELSLSKSGFGIFLLVVLLMPINWGFETIKWKVLVDQFQKINYNDAFKSVMAGVSLAIMTPGRIGEYGGKLISIHPENRPKAILANLISSIGQNIINIGLGLAFTLIFVQHFTDLQSGVFISLLTISVSIIFVMLLIYFKFDLIDGLLAYLPDYKWVNKVRSNVRAFDKLDTSTLIRILGLSFFRYTVYLAQYVLLLYFFGVTDQIWVAIMGVGTIFFLQSNLPLPPAFSVLARGEMAIFLWSYFTDNVIGILAATFSLWFINLVIPAILGAYMLSSYKLNKD
ncbi:MAG: hypothetical protein V3V14_09915 [Saprospiraceae bacterium]